MNFKRTGAQNSSKYDLEQVALHEISEVLGVSAITVKRDWRIARAMLRNELRGGDLDQLRTSRQ